MAQTKNKTSKIWHHNPRKQNLTSIFPKNNHTTTNGNTDLLEYHTPQPKIPFLPFSLFLFVFDSSHSLHTKEHAGSEKQKFVFLNAPTWIKLLCNDCRISQINKLFPHRKQLAEKQNFKEQNLHFNPRTSIDTNGPISPSSEANSYSMVLVDAFKHYVALNAVSYCNAICASTTLYG